MDKYAIDEGFLQDIETLEMIIRNNTAGLFGGMHQSKVFGSSCEFADHREYIPGDDITKIDWNQYGKTEKLYLKQYLDERRLHTRIYIDASTSMDYDCKKANKAVQIAAAFAYISLCSMDKVSIYYVQNNNVHEACVNLSGRDQFYAKITNLNNITFNGDFNFSEAIKNENVGYGDGLSIIISDFLTDNNYNDGIDYLVSKKRDVLCVQLLSKNELCPQDRGKVHFYDSEDSNNYYRKNINKDVIKAYREAVKYLTNSLESFCVSRGAKYILASDEILLLDLFLSFLPSKEVLK